jgi:hypothetical protein
MMGRSFLTNRFVDIYIYIYMFAYNEIFNFINKGEEEFKRISDKWYRYVILKIHFLLFSMNIRVTYIPKAIEPPIITTKQNIFKKQKRSTHFFKKNYYKFLFYFLLYIYIYIKAVTRQPSTVERNYRLATSIKQ